MRRIALAASLVALTAACQRPVASHDPSRAVIDSLFTRFSQAGMPGASVLVMRHDSVLLSGIL